MSVTRKLVLAGAVLMISTCSFSQEVLSVEGAIQIALENNYNIKIVRNSEKIAENDFSRGNAGFMPNVNLNAGKTFQTADTYQEPFTGAPREIDAAKTESFTSSATVNWQIFNGLGMFYTYDRLGKQREIAGLQSKVQMENLIANLLSGYYTVAVEIERIKVLTNTIQLSERRLEIAKNKFDVGKASKVEYLAAQVDYNADKAALANEERILIQAKVDINNLLSRSINTEFTVNETIDINETLLIGQLLEAANMKNPALLQSQRQLNVAHLQMQEIRAERYPGVFLVGGYFYNVNNSQAGFFAVNQQNGYNYGITASWSVFNGLNLNRRVQNAKILAESAELTNESLQLSLEADISKAYAGYQTNLNLIAIERLNLEVAKENEEIALERYQLGNSTPLELREAQINAVQAESRLINAAFSTKLAEIELLRLSGSLIQTYSE